MSLVIICLAITATLMVSLQNSEEPEEVRMTMEEVIKGEVAKMAQIDDANARKAKEAALQEAKASKKKAAGNVRPSLMTMSNGDLSKLKSSDEYKDRMEDEDNIVDVSDNELAMPSVTKEGEVSMFQDKHESSEARQLNRLLNGDGPPLLKPKKKKTVELDSFQASLLGEKIAPKKPKRVKPRVHLSRLLEPRSTNAVRPRRPHHKVTAKMKRHTKQQEQHKRKEAKKMNVFREHMKSFWAQTHAADPNNKPKPVPKPAPKKKVECKPPMCLPRGHHYEHGKVQHGHKAVITALEQAYPVSTRKPKKPVSIWDRDDTFSPIATTAQDLISSSVVPKLKLHRKHKQKKKAKRRMSLEDLVGELASKDAPPAIPLLKKKAKKAKKVVQKVVDEDPWEQDHFARRMSNTWHKENAMTVMKTALLNAEHSNALENARRMAPTLNRHERIEQKSAMLKQDLKAQSMYNVKETFNRDFKKRQQAAKAAAIARMQQKKRLQRQRVKKAKVENASATKVAADAVEAAFANVFDESWQKKGASMGLNIPHGPKA